MYEFSNKSKERMLNVDARLQEVAYAALKISKVDFGIPSSGGRRTAQEQNNLFNQGASMCDGYDELSKHQHGKALDFYAYVDGKASWDELHLAMVATAFLEAATVLGIKLRWGGNFKNFKDMPHMELRV